MEESKKLLELGLSAESADMWYERIDHELTEYSCNPLLKSDAALYKGLPCWSLGALLDILPEEIEYENTPCFLDISKRWISYEGYDSYDSSYTIQPVVFKDKPFMELLFDTTCWLLEHGYLKNEA